VKKFDDVLRKSGFFNYREFYKAVAKRNWTRLVEVGAWHGHSIIFLARCLRSPFELYAVDLWEDLRGVAPPPNAPAFSIDNAFALYNYHLRREGVRNLITDIRRLSWEAAALFEDASLDFVFIDASHDEASVARDIAAWLPKVRVGGMLAGHDRYHPGVKAAIAKCLHGRAKPTPLAKSVWRYCP